MSDKKWEIKKSAYVLTTPYIKVRHDECVTFRGHQADYYVVERQPAVGIIAFTTDHQLILERQYRHPAGEWMIEIPAGLVNDNEEPASTIRRELLEETGYQVDQIKEIQRLYTSAGIMQHSYNLYLGFDAVRVQDQKLDQSEDLEVFLASIDEAIKLVNNREIKSAETIVGIMLARDYVNEYGYSLSF